MTDVPAAVAAIQSAQGTLATAIAAIQSAQATLDAALRALATPTVPPVGNYKGFVNTGQSTDLPRSKR